VRVRADRIRPHVAERREQRAGRIRVFRYPRATAPVLISNILPAETIASIADSAAVRYRGESGSKSDVRRQLVSKSKCPTMPTAFTPPTRRSAKIRLRHRVCVPQNAPLRYDRVVSGVLSTQKISSSTRYGRRTDDVIESIQRNCESRSHSAPQYSETSPRYACFSRAPRQNNPAGARPRSSSRRKRHGVCTLNPSEVSPASIAARSSPQGALSVVKYAGECRFCRIIRL
jgi:hypothetical protein